jgi:hypothetical protein
LKQPFNNPDEEFERLNLIAMKPVRIYPFAKNCGFYCAFAPIGDEKVLLMSTSKNQKQVLQVELV